MAPIWEASTSRLDYYTPIRILIRKDVRRRLAQCLRQAHVFFNREPSWQNVNSKCSRIMCDRSEVEDLGMNCIQHYPLSLSCLSQLKCQNVLAIPSFEGQTSNQTPRPYKSKPPNSRSSTKIPGRNRGK